MKKPVSGKKSIEQIKFKKAGDMPPAAISLASMLYNKTGKWRSIRPMIDLNKCTSCMLCWKFCPDVAIKIIDGKPYIDLDYCKGCAICIEECPVKAIRTAEEKK